MGTKFKVKGMQFSQTPGIGAHLARQAVKAASAAQIPELTPEQMKGMSQRDVMAYNAKRSRINMGVNRKTQRYGRKAAKLDQSLELKQAQLAHGTIRQGLAELAGLGAEGVGSYAVTKAAPSTNAIVQNTLGGIKEGEESTEETEDSGNGPVARGRHGRREE